MEKLLDENNKIIISLLDSLSVIEETVNMSHRISKKAGVLNGEIYLTDEDLSQALKLSCIAIPRAMSVTRLTILNINS